MEKDRLFSWHSLFLVILGISVNIVGAKLILLFKLPMFLDSVGTIVSAALGGYLPGILVGFFSNCINSVSDPITLYYGVLSVIFALLAAHFSSIGLFTRFVPTMLCATVFAFVGGVIGSLMTWALYGLNFGTGISAPFAEAINNYTEFGKFWSQLSADALIDLIDKLVTMLIVFFCLNSLPSKTLEKFPLGAIYDNNSSPKLEKIKYSVSGLRKGINYRNLSLRDKVVMLIITTSVMLSSVGVIVSYVIYEDTMNQRYVELCKTAINMMHSALDGDKVEQYIKDGKQTPEYLETEKELKLIKDNMPTIEYIYVYRIEEDGCHVVFDIDTPEVPGNELGEIVPIDESFEKYMPNLLAGDEIPPVIAKGQYGWLLTVYSPIRNGEGKCVAYAATDTAMSEVISDRYVFVIRMTSLLFGVSVIIIAFAIWFAQQKIALPINALADTTRKLAYDSEDDRQKNIEQLRSLNIRTGDEIESLYDAISKTTADVGDYIRQINEKNADVALKAEVIARLQDNIIISFASMVESRDSNTGGHIKRTAGYVKLIGEELRRRGVDSGKLTDGFLLNMFKSAPLHDIGKIKIPDAILNKPGKLTPAEFDVVKTHTTAGCEILSNVLKGIEEDNYLSEAINMAAYHHERWDGTGYPCGLSGSDIPICARVMALADVFDALISRRSYKEAFPFDEAVDIIVSESKSHFDPEVVSAFLSVKDEIRRLSEDIGEE